MDLPDNQQGFCHFLRGKNAYGTLEGGGNPFMPFDPATSTYRCLCTMMPVGPDGQPAHVNFCKNAGRNCFKPLDVKEG